MEKVKIYLKKYFVTAMGAMAQGLFATLLIGTIIKTVGQYTGLDFLVQIASFASSATGMAIGVTRISTFVFLETYFATSHAIITAKNAPAGPAE